MDRESAWMHYFNTGDREPLVLAYEDSIKYLAWARYPSQKEDMVQVGMMGLLKAIDRIDPKRVKSKDAWVWLNVKGMMFNVTAPKPTIALDSDLANLVLPSHEDETDFDLMVGTLPLRQKVILTLIYKHDWHKTEIADLFNLSSMRIGQIEQQALETLRTGGEVV